MFKKNIFIMGKLFILVFIIFYQAIFCLADFEQTDSELDISGKIDWHQMDLGGTELPELNNPFIFSLAIDYNFTPYFKTGLEIGYGSTYSNVFGDSTKFNIYPVNLRFAYIFNIAENLQITLGSKLGYTFFNLVINSKGYIIDPNFNFYQISMELNENAYELQLIPYAETSYSINENLALNFNFGYRMALNSKTEHTISLKTDISYDTSKIVDQPVDSNIFFGGGITFSY